MEAQRPVLGDAAVNAALFPIQEKLAKFEELTDPLKEVTYKTPLREHKLVSLLYMNAVGSTAMTQHLELEDTLDIMDN